MIETTTEEIILAMSITGIAGIIVGLLIGILIDEITDNIKNKKSWQETEHQ